MNRKSVFSPPRRVSFLHRSFAAMQKPPPTGRRRLPTHNRSLLPALPMLRQSALRQNTERSPVHVFVVEDGVSASTAKAFPYIITPGTSIVRLLNASCERLNPQKRFTYVFSFFGEPLDSLYDVADSMKILLVSDRIICEGLQNDGKEVSESALYERFRSEESLKGRVTDRSPRMPRASSMKQKTTSPKRNALNPVAKVDELLKPLTPEQIQQLAQEFGLARGRIHALYARFKTLLALHLSSNPGCGMSHTDASLGISKDTFVNHLRGALIYGPVLLSRLFDAIDTNGNGYLSWLEFLKAMSYLSVGTKREKIALYFRVFSTQLYDCNTSGALSYDEVRELCLLTLGHASRDSIVEDTADYFASAVFKKAQMDKDGEITLERLLEVLENEEDEEFMQLFCFVDVE